VHRQWEGNAEVELHRETLSLRSCLGQGSWLPELRAERDGWKEKRLRAHSIHYKDGLYTRLDAFLRNFSPSVLSRFRRLNELRYSRQCSLPHLDLPSFLPQLFRLGYLPQLERFIFDTSSCSIRLTPQQLQGSFTLQPIAYGEHL
jgi:hypothetical protein